MERHRFGRFSISIARALIVVLEVEVLVADQVLEVVVGSRAQESVACRRRFVISIGRVESLVSEASEVGRRVLIRYCQERCQ